MDSRKNHKTFTSSSNDYHINGAYAPALGNNHPTPRDQQDLSRTAASDSTAPIHKSPVSSYWPPSLYQAAQYAYLSPTSLPLRQKHGNPTPEQVDTTKEPWQPWTARQWRYTFTTEQSTPSKEPWQPTHLPLRPRHDTPWGEQYTAIEQPWQQLTHCQRYDIATTEQLTQTFEPWDPSPFSFHERSRTLRVPETEDERWTNDSDPLAAVYPGLETSPASANASCGSIYPADTQLERNRYKLVILLGALKQVSQLQNSEEAYPCEYLIQTGDTEDEEVYHTSFDPVQEVKPPSRDQINVYTSSPDKPSRSNEANPRPPPKHADPSSPQSPSKTLLKQHPSSDEETTNPPLYCPSCPNKPFTGPYAHRNLTWHTASFHTLQNIPCSERGCTSTFARDDALLVHLRRSHTELNVPAARKRRRRGE